MLFQAIQRTNLNFCEKYINYRVGTTNRLKYHLWYINLTPSLFKFKYNKDC